MHRKTASGMLAGLTLVALLAAPAASAEPASQADCQGDLRITQRSYANGTVQTGSISAAATGGSDLTAFFELAGCGDEQLSLVAYDASAGFRLTSQTLHDVDTGTFGAGNHNLSVHVPVCFHVAFVFGAAIEQFLPPNGTYHGEDRIIAAAMGGIGCGAPAAKVEVCPPDLTGQAQDDRITLSWNATGGAATHLVYRAEGRTSVLLAEINGNASSHIDATAEAGTAYTYELVATSGNEATPCASVQVGSMPTFPTPLAAALAVTIGVLGYAWGTRRR